MMSRAARFAIAASVLLFDRLSKFWIEQHVSAFDTLPVLPGVFHIIHAQNRGAAFGVLNDHQGPLRAILLIGVAAAVMAFVAVQLWRFPKGGWVPGHVTPVALALVLGGAAGNLYDRIVRGSVTDFLQVFIGPYEWPSFNVADSAITIGAGLLILTLWQARPAATA